MIVDPWGEVLARVTDPGPGYCTADLDFSRQAEVRDKLPSLANRQAAAYVWPQEAGVR
jgi:predicted amidohydrolase